jgi:hypothetical protein
MGHIYANSTKQAQNLRKGVIMAVKEAVKAVGKKAEVIASNEEQLTYHLNKAEEHLIEAVKIFERKHPPKRSLGYIDRLVRAQEMVTLLYREELIRIRGPIKMTAAAVIRRKK